MQGQRFRSSACIHSCTSIGLGICTPTASPFGPSIIDWIRLRVFEAASIQAAQIAGVGQIVPFAREVDRSASICPGVAAILGNPNQIGPPPIEVMVCSPGRRRGPPPMKSPGLP